MSVNLVILVGNLGKDPEVRHTSSGVSVASFPLATSERYKDRDGQRQEKTEWHNIIVWREMADNAAKFLTKGSKIYVEGKIQTRSYDDRDGMKKYITEIVADKIRFLDSKPQDSHRPAQEQGGYRQDRQPSRNEPAFQDDIPF